MYSRGGGIRHEFSKKNNQFHSRRPSIFIQVALYNKYTRALTFQILFCVSGFETRFLMEKEAELQRLAQEEEQRRLEEEKLRRKQANRGKTRGYVKK